MKQDELINFKSISKVFRANLFVSNFGVVYCYNLIFNLNILKRNIGFYFFFIMLFLEIILFILFLYKKLKPIKSYMLSFRLLNKNENNTDNKKKKVKIKIEKFNQKEEIKNDKGNLILSNNKITNNNKKIKKKKRLHYR